MSNRKRPSKGFQERTTMSSPVGITIEQNGGNPVPLTRHYVGADHAPTDEEALEMGRALFDSIVTEVAKNARAEESSSPSR